jgi:methyl-accepting chemotaxis protein
MNWFLNQPLSRKQIVVLLIAGLLPMIMVGVIALQVASTQIERKAFDQLEAVREIKADAVKRYFQTVESQIKTQAASLHMIEAMSAFSRSFKSVVRADLGSTGDLDTLRAELRSYYENDFGAKYRSEVGKAASVDALMADLDAEAILMQHKYIYSNLNPLGEKHLLDASDGRSVYHSTHGRIHPGIRQFLEEFGYYDIFLVDINSGDIVYSVFKELDYATSLLDGPYRNTNFAEAFRDARQLQQGEVVIKDYATYTPSYEAPASFAATPVYQGGRAIGVLIFQMPLEPINVIMTERSGMGETGESYLVGEDKLMRSDSYLDPVNHTVSASFANPKLGSVNTEAVTRAFAGEKGSDIIIDYNGNPVLSAFTKVDIGHFSWVALAEIDKAEAFAGTRKLTMTILALALFIAVALFFAAVFVSRMISRPILALSDAIQQVERSGHFDTQLNNPHNDEVGQTSRAFNNLLSNLSSAINDTNGSLSALGSGDFNSRVRENYPGDLGTLAAGVNNAIESVKVASQESAEQAQRAAESSEKAQQAAQQAQAQARSAMIIKQALDVSATAVMIADENFIINYGNKSLDTLFANTGDELSSALPQFDAKNWLGKSIDSFHADPSHQRKLLQGLQETYRTQINVASLTFSLAATPIRDESGEFLGAVVEWEDLTAQLARELEEKRIADENARIRQALDASSTSTMIADANFNIIYTNDSLSEMMSKAENDLREHMGQFDASALLGANMDVFHKNPAHQRQLLESLSSTYSNQVQAGERYFNIVANPIQNEQGERLGTVVEWTDRTAEVGIEKEIDGIIEAAANGDFGRHIEMGDKSGFFKKISEGLNRLMQTTNVALEDIIRVFSALARGDLSQTIDREYDGEFAILKNDANATVEKLKQVMGEISSGSAEIARSAKEISSGNADLSQRTEEQASSLEETASSMEEMTTVVQKSEENAQQANERAQHSVSIAREGDQSVKLTAKAMKEISSSSEKISNIISVIDEIAFQTNLLALNAAVEAARAGEQGRGFAVVAGEVRNLAQRSASAAKEIKDLINDSVAKVEEGEKLVENSGKTLNQIVEEISQVGAMMEDILSSAREQSAGIGQVSSAVSQMDQITQQNAALVEEASAASESMADQAARLDKLVAFFKG